MISICFIGSRYPTAINPTIHVFLRQLVWTFADLGIDCSVVSPVPINANYRYNKLPLRTMEYTQKGSCIRLYFPRYISMGQKNRFGINGARITSLTFTNAVRKQINRLKNKPSILYGHFLSPAGICVSRIGKEYCIPSFAAFGESTPWSIIQFGKEKMAQELSCLSGIISVSTENKRLLQEMGIYRTCDIEVFPNGVRSEHFYPRDKKLSRELFGFNQNDFIVAYVGQFSERKGVMRVSKALDGIKNISVAYAGKGNNIPTNSNTIHCSTVRPEYMPFFLSSADAFLLPTISEGCCNAIIEAMACGLPIISSNIPCNFDILDGNNSILIDPVSIEQIRDAVILLKNSPDLREKMGRASIKKASQLSLELRAKSILEWISGKIDARSRVV